LAILIPFACFLNLSWQDLQPGMKYALFAIMLTSYGFTIPGTVLDLSAIFG
jgi:hypothetical protein